MATELCFQETVLYQILSPPSSQATPIPAIVYDNNWVVERHMHGTFNTDHNILRYIVPHEIYVFDVEIKNEEIFISGKLYFNGSSIPINDESIRIETFDLHSQ